MILYKSVSKKVLTNAWFLKLCIINIKFIIIIFIIKFIFVWIFTIEWFGLVILLDTDECDTFYLWIVKELLLFSHSTNTISFKMFSK